jgi:hypothetical protein
MKVKLSYILPEMEQLPPNSSLHRKKHAEYTLIITIKILLFAIN